MLTTIWSIAWPLAAMAKPAAPIRVIKIRKYCFLIISPLNALSVIVDNYRFEGFIPPERPLAELSSKRVQMMRRASRYEVTESDVKISTPAGLDYVSRTLPLELRSINIRAPRVTSDGNMHHDFVVPCSRPIIGKRSATPGYETARPWLS